MFSLSYIISRSLLKSNTITSSLASVLKVVSAPPHQDAFYQSYRLISTSAAMNYEKERPESSQETQDSFKKRSREMTEEIRRAEDKLESLFFMAQPKEYNTKDSGYSYSEVPEAQTDVYGYGLAKPRSERSVDTSNLKVKKSRNMFYVEMGKSVAYMKFHEDESTMKIIKTEVPEQFRGKRVAAKLARHALAYARLNDLKLKLECAYVTDFIRLHAQEYQDLVID